jgi:hypothetical protein
LESPASIADRTMIGRSACDLISRARVRPSIRAIIMSMIRRSGQLTFRRRSASSPSRAVIVSKPSAVSCSASRTSRFGSSSTMRMRGDPPRNPPEAPSMAPIMAAPGGPIRA